MVQHTQLKWVKNIKRENGTAWAYMEAQAGEEFQLNFSLSQKRGASNIKAGEAILLFQAVDKVRAVTRKTYLTHLVMPIDDILFYNPCRADFPMKDELRLLQNLIPTQPFFLRREYLIFMILIEVKYVL